MFAPFEIFALRVQQPMADTIIIDRVEPKPPYEPISGDGHTVRSGCDVSFTLTKGRRMKAKLTFRGDAFEGTVTDMEYGGGDSGGGWTCRVANAKLTGTRIR